MKSLRLIIHIAFPLVCFNCVNTDPVGSSSAAPPQTEHAAGMTLAVRSGFTDTPLAMPDPLPPAEGVNNAQGEWATTTDSSGALVAIFSSLIDSSVMYPADGIKLAATPELYSSLVLSSDASFRMPEGGRVQPQASSGLLTAGEWNDHLHWSDFRSFTREYPGLLRQWQLNLQRRVLLKLVDTDNTPVPGARITVASENRLLFEGTTLGDGCVAFFPLNHRCEKSSRYDVAVDNQEFSFSGEFTPVDDDDQTWVIRVDRTVCTARPTLDLVFTVDVTGSMGDELSFIQAELLDICDKVSSTGILDLRIGFVFYRDRGDLFVTKVFPFSTDAVSVKNNIATMTAGGGGDGPESVNLALKHTMQNLEWRTDRNCIRLCFLVADAKPHYYRDEQYTYSEALDEAVEKGIKLLPVAGSGIDKSTEYLFRQMAVKTMGKYIFITDDSGIGGSHIDPDIGAHDVETLNEIIVRTINEEVHSWQ